MTSACIRPLSVIHYQSLLILAPNYTAQGAEIYQNVKSYFAAFLHLRHLLAAKATRLEKELMNIDNSSGLGTLLDRHQVEPPPPPPHGETEIKRLRSEVAALRSQVSRMTENIRVTRNSTA